MHMFDQLCACYIFLFIVDHLQLNLECFYCHLILEERNLKIVRDPWKALKSIK